jgi:hypothetical protein
VRPVSQPQLNKLYIIIKIYFELFSYLLCLWTFHYSFPLLLLFWVFFISSTSILQMANTRNYNTNAENNLENNDVANLPPPTPPTLEQVLAIQA